MEGSFNFSSKTIDASSIKRELLTNVGSMFDLIGFLTPFILKVRLLLYSMWRLEIRWDNESPTQQAEFWHKWLKGFANIN